MIIGLGQGLTFFASTAAAGNAQPSVSWNAPAAASQQNVGVAVTLSVTAADTDGTITSVAYEIDVGNTGSFVSLGAGSLTAGTSANGTWTYSWTPTEAQRNATVVLRAVATDSGGATNSATRTVEVWSPLTIGTPTLTSLAVDWTGSAAGGATASGTVTYEATGFNGLPSLVFASGGHMRADAIAGNLSGDDTPFLLAHVFQPTATVGNAAHCIGFGNTGDANPLGRVLFNNAGNYEFGRRAAAGAVPTVATGQAPTTNREAWVWLVKGNLVSVWRNNVKVLTDGAIDSASVTFNTYTIGGLRRTGALELGFVQRYAAHYLWAGGPAKTDTEAEKLAAFLAAAYPL